MDILEKVTKAFWAKNEKTIENYLLYVLTIVTIVGSVLVAIATLLVLILDEIEWILLP